MHTFTAYGGTALPPPSEAVFAQAINELSQRIAELEKRIAELEDAS